MSCRRNYQDKTKPPKFLRNYHILLIFLRPSEAFFNHGESFLNKFVGSRCHDSFRFLLFWQSSAYVQDSIGMFPLPAKEKKSKTAENPLCFPNGSASTGSAKALPWCSAAQFRCSAARWWQKWRHNLEIRGVWRGELVQPSGKPSWKMVEGVHIGCQEVLHIHTPHICAKRKVIWE